MVKRVVILGGGVAALTAAWELSRPELAADFEVTVYQLGWRLGGKGASGRDGQHHQRILEHGLHLFLGFYDNAFRMLRECYAELDRPPDHPMRAWTDAFKRAAHIGLAEQHRGVFRHVRAHLPEDDRLPGEPGRSASLGGVALLARANELALSLIDGLYARPLDGEPPHGLRPAWDARGAFQLGAGALRNALQTALITGLLGALHSLRGLLQRSALCDASLAADMDSITDFLERHIAAFLEGDHATRRIWELVALLLAAMRGVVAQGLHRQRSLRDWERIDDYDLRQWLHLHGAPQAALGNPVLKGIYDIAFAYQDGDPGKPRYAAGQALRAAARFFFESKGAPFWEMQAGMGDVVFAPLYLALRRRGVRFAFFHKLVNVGLNARQSAVERLDFSKQVPGDVAAYDPLIHVKGLECWPAAPKWELIEGGRIAGAELEAQSDASCFGDVRLQAGADFEHVVFGLGVASIPLVARELLCSERWRQMVRHVATVRTQSAQLWLDVGREQLGWPHSKAHVSAYVEPFDTWADMSHLLAVEDWPEQSAPRSIAYLANAMPSGRELAHDPLAAPPPADPSVEAGIVQRNLVRFLKHDAGFLWPKAVRSYPDDFRWELLSDDRDGSAEQVRGQARLQAQYWRANCNASDRYTACLPGSTKYRIAPDDTGFERLTIAGDWTWNALNVGCVEAAVTSGQLAANAICGHPRIDEIVGLQAELEPEGMRARRMARARSTCPATDEARRVVEALSLQALADLRSGADERPLSEHALGLAALQQVGGALLAQFTPAPAALQAVAEADADAERALPAPRAGAASELVEQVLDEYGSQVRSALLSAIPNQEPRRHLYDLIGEYPRRGGRMFRSCLCLASARAFGASLDDALPSAVALELLHNAFLIHDDIEDESVLRRGAPTLNAKHGNALALNAGDGLVMLAMDALRDNFRRLGPEIAGLVFDEAQRMVKMTVEGQAMDIGVRQEGRLNFGLHEYFDIILKKTCWYTTLAPIRIGALIGGGRALDERRFFRFAFYLGGVFQIVDDVMNIGSTLEAYGKEIAGDLYEGKPTLMLSYLMQQADAAARMRLTRFFASTRARRGADETAWVQRQLIEHGCVERARSVARGLAADAEAEFEACFFDAAASRDRRFIQSLPSYMLEREARSRSLER